MGAFVGGFIGNLAGTAITDAINRNDQSYFGYWGNLIGESLLYGLIAIASNKFNAFAAILNISGFKDIFAGMTIWAEFAFSYLYEANKNFKKKKKDKKNKN